MEFRCQPDGDGTWTCRLGSRTVGHIYQKEGGYVAFANLEEGEMLLGRFPGFVPAHGALRRAIERIASKR